MYAEDNLAMPKLWKNERLTLQPNIFLHFSICVDKSCKKARIRNKIIDYE